MGAMLLTSSFATYNIISTITHEKRADIAIMKSLGMREPRCGASSSSSRSSSASSACSFGWVLGYLLCYGWSKITIFNPLTGTTVPLSIYYSSTHYLIAGGISLACCAGRRPISRRARRRACIRSRSSGARHDRGGFAGGGSGPPHRGRCCAHARQWHRSGGEEGRVRRHHRAVRLGQVLAALSARPARRADRRRGHHLRPADLEAVGDPTAPMSA